MSDVRAHLLPVYVVVDESGSMAPYLDRLSEGLTSLHEALLAEPATAAKVRVSVFGFSSDVAIRLHLADLRRMAEMPPLMSRGPTNYSAAFAILLHQIPRDVDQLIRRGYAVHRPAVVFLSDGQPTDGENWREIHRRLTDRTRRPAAPNIIACGIGDAWPENILDIATAPEFAFVSIAGSDIGATVAKFCTALTRSIVESGRTVGDDVPALVFDRPDGFRMAIDVL